MCEFSETGIDEKSNDQSALEVVEKFRCGFYARYE